VRELDAHPRRWSLASLRLITSAGMRLSADVRARLLAHCPDALCVDILGSSEVPAVGRSRSTASSLAPDGTFAVGPGVRVLDDDDHDVGPGSGAVGTLVVRGRQPLGYYKDPARSDALLRVIDGERWSNTGDLATVHADGTIQLPGRGVTVINTGGEKVYTREVEEALLRDPSVADAAVVGQPHDVLGQMVVAVVQPHPDRSVDVEHLLEQLRTSLAGYKVPQCVYLVDSVGRDDSGKIHYGRLVRRVSELSVEE
jgi:3-oxocholest-4-en-26-oate---CoA ligase